MKMDKVASSQNDEFYTPEYAIKPILKYIKMPCTIWCPAPSGAPLTQRKATLSNCSPNMPPAACQSFTLT